MSRKENNTVLKSLKFKDLGAENTTKLGEKENTTELKSLRFKKLGAKENTTELKSLRFKKDLGKSLPVHVLSSRIMDTNSFSLTKLGVSTEGEKVAGKISMILSIVFIVFMLFRLKNRN